MDDVANVIDLEAHIELRLIARNSRTHGDQTAPPSPMQQSPGRGPSLRTDLLWNEGGRPGRHSTGFCLLDGSTRKQQQDRPRRANLALLTNGTILRLLSLVGPKASDSGWALAAGGADQRATNCGLPLQPGYFAGSPQVRVHLEARG
jgi:hypothetical protein